MQGSRSPPTDCTDFRPSFSNEGLCFTRNGAEVDTMYKKTPYMEIFKKIMIPGRINDTIISNKGSGIQYQYSFMVDANRYKDLKRGEVWNEETEINLKLAIHQPNSIADIRGTGVQIYTGYKTTIRINIIQFYSKLNVKDVNTLTRGCKFENEVEDLGIFSNYSRVNCLFECSMEQAQAICGCLPWDFPRKKDTSKSKYEIPICDFFGSSCFHTLMQTEQGERKCVDKCVSDCNEIKYTISIEQKPLDPNKVCRNKKFLGNSKKFEIADSIWNNIFGIPQEGSDILWKKKTPIDDLIRLLQDALSHPNKSISDEDYCKGKLSMDIGVVHVVVNSPTVLRLVQSIRVSFADKLANIGKA